MSIMRWMGAQRWPMSAARARERVEVAALELPEGERRWLRDRLVCQDLADALAAQGAALLGRVDHEPVHGCCVAQIAGGAPMRLHVAVLGDAIGSGNGSGGRIGRVGPAAWLEAVDAALASVDAQAAAEAAGLGGTPYAVCAVLLAEPAMPVAPDVLGTLPVVEWFGFGPYRCLRAAYVLASNPARPSGWQALRVGIETGQAGWRGETVLGRRRGA
ncbi:hypothetical protein BKK79_18555 [Cupriavidus sp. USMAA2-4]|uniref:hypothetical protein n=1 Tax=Cupriavidus sp. USMAA2-4 TaxID=876364 RepID=UPI0008A6808C|nr:hypothetical protein [Cupriavidus sp. USMAA2-4]AOY93578.1 hypothetical protein BKK79_18555 [Cupriavidus sp. USMAA2-4]